MNVAEKPPEMREIRGKHSRGLYGGRSMHLHCVQELHAWRVMRPWK
jgi:hypothetical protein